MIVKHDFHIHTHYSDGASSPAKMVEAGFEKGLKAVAITDHGPEIHVGIKKGEIEQMIEDVSLVKNDASIPVILGIEANILGSSGQIDISRNVLQKLDIVSAGVHDMGSYMTSAELAREYFERVINCLEREKIDVLTHPFWYHEDLSKYYDKEELEYFAEIAVETDTAVELNEKYQVPKKELLILFLESGVDFCLGSDAHKEGEVGWFRWGLKTLKSLGVGKEQLIVENYL